MKLKQRPEDFVVREGYRFDEAAEGPVWVYRMDKQKVSTLQALERLSKEFSVRRRDLSVCGLKDKQGRTEQLVGVMGGPLAPTEIVQSGDLRLKLLGRTAEPLSSDNITANRFEVTIRDLSRAEAERVPESVAEVERVGVVNYFDSQRFGFLKHGQGLIAKDLLKSDFEAALKRFMAMPSELDRSDDAKVKRFWGEHWGEWQLRAPGEAAARYAPVLRQLRQDPTNFKGAFMHIDRRIRMMMLFELQSLVWNEGVKRYLSKKIPAAEMIGLRYQAGALVMPRSLPKELRDDLWRRTFPLLAPDSKIDDPEVRAAALDTLAMQQLNLKDLVVPGTPLFFKHEERPMFVRPGKLRVNPPRPDDLNRNKQKVNLSFTLPPGAYATLVVRRTLWFATEGARSMGDAPQPTSARPDRAQRAPASRTTRAPPPEASEEVAPRVSSAPTDLATSGAQPPAARAPPARGTRAPPPRATRPPAPVGLLPEPAAPLPAGQKWGQPLSDEAPRHGEAARHGTPDHPAREQRPRPGAPFRGKPHPHGRKPAPSGGRPAPSGGKSASSGGKPGARPPPPPGKEAHRPSENEAQRPPGKPIQRPYDDKTTRAERRAKLFPQGEKARSLRAPDEQDHERPSTAQDSPRPPDQPLTPPKGFRERQRERKAAKVERRGPGAPGKRR